MNNRVLTNVDRSGGVRAGGGSGDDRCALVILHRFRLLPATTYTSVERP